jgi:hypothetical protein
LPTDFIKFYTQVNGMSEFYLDQEGFSFCPIAELVTLETWEKNYNGVRYPSLPEELQHIIIFVDYLYACWIYGVQVADENTYSIGIIAEYGQFNVITNSLQDFIELYLVDSEKLYDC